MVSAVGGSSSFSLASLQSTQRPTPQERFSTADADSSGGLSVEEYSSFAPDFVEDIEGSFTQIDSDGDGQLTDSELSSFAESEGLQGAGGPPPGGGPPPSSEESEDESYDILDTNEDGTVSAEELSSALQDANDFFTALLSAQEESLAA